MKRKFRKQLFYICLFLSFDKFFEEMKKGYFDSVHFLQFFNKVLFIYLEISLFFLMFGTKSVSCRRGVGSAACTLEAG